jgi:hypothetical protein
VSRDFCLWFFHESVSPQPQSIPLGPFGIFSKIHGSPSQGAPPGINDTSGKFATGISDTGTKDTGSKFATGVNNTGGKHWEQLSDC